VSAQALRAPWPWFGAKDRAAAVVWAALGNVTNYVEPFAGSLSVLLARPHEAHIETVNDLDGFVCNFWRAVSADPDAVAAAADWPTNETDLAARHRWLTARRADLEGRLASDPDYFDAKVAGWWCWGACAWIGSGWCLRGNRQLPHLASAGTGVHSFDLRDRVPEALQALRDRLRRTRVACGDWSRVVTPSITTKCHGAKGRMLTGVFLDPPYAEGDVSYSATSSIAPAPAAARWAAEHGDDPWLRIILCGHEGEHEMPPTWRCVPWTPGRGYAVDDSNRHRERLWLSPHCLDGTRQRGLFDAAGAQ
jgi:DNA adenine methylase